MHKVNLISTKPEHDLILKDRQTTLAPNHQQVRKGLVAATNLEMEQPVLEVNNEINRASGDPGS